MNSPSTDPRELRKFGLTMAGILVGLFGAIPLARHHQFRAWPWVIGAVFASAAIFAPRALAPVQRGWMKLGNVLGWVNSRIVLGIAYVIIVIPIGAFRRLLGADPLDRGIDRKRSSYRIARNGRGPASQMERMF